MDLKNIFRTGIFRRAVGKAALCLLLAGLGLAAVRGAWSIAVSKEPFVDFSRRDAKTPKPPTSPTEHGNRLRFAVATMVSAEATFSTYRRLVQRICRDVGHREAFVVRPSYTDVREALEQGKIDIAFVCTGTYVHSLRKKRIRLLAQPEFEEPLEYRCLVIVPAKSNAEALEDLRGTVMAFTDPESNTGCLVPTATLMNRGNNPKSFFKKIVFTGSHDRSILAVALSVVDAAAIDALVWESKLLEDPHLAEKVRIIWRSEVFGPPPIVVPTGGDATLAKSLQEALLALNKDDEGRAILSAIGIRRFVRPRPEGYQSAVELYRQLERQGAISWP
jgi:phosphonate transport system substrate-binding protein